MLSVGAVCFEDRFCTSRKGETGGGGSLVPGAEEERLVNTDALPVN